MGSVNNEFAPRTAVVFVTSLDDPHGAKNNPAVHPQGQIFRRELIAGLKDRYASFDVISAIPAVSFPRGAHAFVRRKDFCCAGGPNVQTLSYVNVPLLKPVSVGLSTLFRLIGWRMKHARYDRHIVILLNLTMPPGLFTWIAARLVGARLVVYLCDVTSPGRSCANTFANRCNALLERALVRRFDAHIVVSDRIATDFLKDAPYVRIEGGISQGLIEESERLLPSRSEQNTGIFKIIATGSLDEHNGFREIISAFEKLEGKEYRLAVAGRGPLSADIRALAARDPRVAFHGFLSQNDLLTLHSTGDVLLNMRLTQGPPVYGFPSKTLEYFMSGVPVITTRVGALVDELQEACFVLNEETPDALAALIRDVACLPQDVRLTRGLAARDFMIRTKTWARQCDRIAEYIKQQI